MIDTETNFFKNHFFYIIKDFIDGYQSNPENARRRAKSRMIEVLEFSEKEALNEVEWMEEAINSD